MATNRFRGHFNTEKDFDAAKAYGLLPGVLAELDIVADLTEEGAGVDASLNEDYSSTATFASYKATADCVIHRMILSIGLSTFTGAAAQDFALWLGGAAALTNGIVWGVGSSGTVTPALYGSGAAKTIEQFASVWGADVHRDTYGSDATAGDNHDHIVVTLDFVKMFGYPIRVNKDKYIGVFLNDALNTSGLTFTGKVTGRFIYD